MAKAKIFTKAIRNKLEENYANQNPEGGKDFKPVVKLFNCFGQGTWLLTEIDEHDIAYGLCDLGMGAELGYVCITELYVTLNWRLERDQYFKADKTLNAYAKEARAAGGIVS
tara:strand:+ start:2642 stop:2977 length:336 start_codon:yes stop_codon:yes gene_type:complete